MPELNDDECTVEEMTDDELEQALEEAIDATGESTEVTGFVPRDS